MIRTHPSWSDSKSGGISPHSSGLQLQLIINSVVPSDPNMDHVRHYRLESLMSCVRGLALLCAFMGLSNGVTAAEYPIGAPALSHGMEIAAVYLQPIEMDPAGMMRTAADSDVHLEADIHALADNSNGFAEGDWMPALAIRYEITKADTDETLSGTMMPMVAADGPHYGDNVKLMGPGAYRLKLTISGPDGDQHAAFGRHVDKETGVGPWFPPFETSYEFVFAGVGKKGGY
jgi:uncharacterized protein involved in high-affinity Fe2+ transport